MPQMQLELRDAMQSSVRRWPQPYERKVPLVFQVALAADEAPAYWTPSRDDWLRKFWQSEGFLASSVFSLCQRNAGFKYELKGTNEADLERARFLLETAEFGEGWQELSLKLSQDLYTQDRGCFMEVIRPARARINGRSYPAFRKRNRATKDLEWWAVKSRVGHAFKVAPEDVSDSPLDLPIGLAHLDSAKCTRTGDPDEPVIYTDYLGGEHVLKFWQVISMADMPSPIEEMHGVGFCMVSRLLRNAQTVRDWTIYREEKISGRFARAVHLTNVDSAWITDAIDKAMADADEQGLLRYSQPIITNTLDPNARPWNVTIPLAELPEGWDEDTMMRWYVGLVALAAGEHYSFFAPMPGRRLGSAREVEVQERQARGKSSRWWMQALTAKLNNSGVFPDGVVFTFGEKDPEEQKANEESQLRRAQTRRERIESGEITPAIARQIASDQGDLDQRYLDMLGEADLTPEQAQGIDLEEEGEHPIETNPDRADVVEEKQEVAYGEPPTPWGDRRVPITEEDIARAVAKWNERLPESAAGLLLAERASEAQEMEVARAV